MWKTMCATAILSLLFGTAAQSDETLWKSLHLDYPERGFIGEAAAEKWDHSLITGNGTIGLSVPGHVPIDGVVLSHERLFLPAYEPKAGPALGPHLPRIRELLLDGQNIEANRLAWQVGQEMGYPEIMWTNPFVPACVLRIEMDDPRQPDRYARSVDFESALASVAWEQDGDVFHRKAFVSRPAGIAAMLLASPTGAKIDVTLQLIELTREEKRKPKYVLDDVIESVESTAEGNWLSYTTRFKAQWQGALQGAGATARVIRSGGQQETVGSAIHITGAEQILILMDVDVFWEWPADGADSLKPGLSQVPNDFEQLLAEHAAVHGAMFRRVRLELGDQDDMRLSAEALQASSEIGDLNPALTAKLFDAARYNIICSTGELPPTLQGIWGATWSPPWSGDFTQDGNVQSAIDGGLNCNIPEVVRAYLDYMTELQDDFRANAREVFDCDGIWVPSRSSDHGRVFHFSERFPGLFWIAGAAWVSQYYYDYWLHTGDETFLREQAIPFMLDSAAFYEDYLYLGSDGKYLISPSYSPEIWPANLPEWSNGTINATMDVASIKGLLRNLLALADEVSLDPERVARWREMLSKMPDYAIDPTTGELKEWCWPDYQNNNAHRHASHLYPMYFGLDPEIAASPELIEACRKAIDARLEYRRTEGKGQSTMAFGVVQKGMAAAHLRDKTLAYEAVDLLCNRFWTPALVSMHNAASGFNLDISGGMPGLVAELLVQSTADEIDLLPVLPDRWPNGRVTGLRARGGFEVDLQWRAGRLTQATIKSHLGRKVRVRYGQTVRDLDLNQGETVRLGPNLK